MIRPTLLALVVVPALALAACAGDDESAGPPDTSSSTATAPTEGETDPETRPVALVATPPTALRRCRRLPALAPACPQRVPEAPFDPGSPIYAAELFPDYLGPGTSAFSLQWGGEHPGEPERDRPPETVHVVVFAGEAPPRARVQAAQPRDGLLEKRRTAFLSFGPTTWGGRRGALLLAPPYPRGGIESNHLLFRWLNGGVDYEVSVHGWEPFTEVAPVLRAVVESIPRR